MANSFYNGGTVPSIGAPGSSSAIRAEFASIAAGFDKMPALSGGVALQLLRVNASGTAIESFTALSVNSAGTFTIATPSSGNSLEINQGASTKGLRISNGSGSMYLQASGGNSIVGTDGAWGLDFATNSTTRFSLSSVGGLFASGATGGDKGAGSVNATALYVNGTAVGTGNGTVTSVSGTGTVNGLTLTGTVSVTGNLTLGGTLSGISLTSQVAGTLPLANGGTGQTSAQAAINSLAGGVGSGLFLRGNGTNMVLSALQAGDIPNNSAVSGSVANALTFNSSGAGAASGSAFSGSSALTISYNTIGAYAATNPSGFTSNVGTVTSVGGTGATNGLTLSGSVSSSGNLTLGGSVTSVASGATIDSVTIGYRNTPQSTNTTAAAGATGDVGKTILATGTITIPNSTFAAGDIISIVNNSGASITITTNLTTTYVAGTATTGTTRTLAQRGIATIYFVSPTVGIIGGSGLT